jgi:hypothetical protein
VRQQFLEQLESAIRERCQLDSESQAQDTLEVLKKLGYVEAGAGEAAPENPESGERDPR